MGSNDTKRELPTASRCGRELKRYLRILVVNLQTPYGPITHAPPRLALMTI